MYFVCNKEWLLEKAPEFAALSLIPYFGQLTARWLKFWTFPGVSHTSQLWATFHILPFLSCVRSWTTPRSNVHGLMVVSWSGEIISHSACIKVGDVVKQVHAYFIHECIADPDGVGGSRCRELKAANRAVIRLFPENGGITMSWHDINGCNDTFEVHRSTLDNHVPQSPVDVLDVGNATSHTINDPASNHSYSVRGRDANGMECETDLYYAFNGN